MTVILDGSSLSCRQVAAVAAGARVELAPEARVRVAANAAEWRALGAPDVLESKEAWLVGERPAEATGEERRRAFVVGHCAGVGRELPDGFVRAMMLARANALTVGLSGCRP